MFDPHRTRRSDRRYYTRKGQVLQASRVNVNPTIDQRLVPIYKNYLIKNNLFQSPSTTIHPIGIAVHDTSTSEITYYPFTEFTVITAPSSSITGGESSTYSALLMFQQLTDGNCLMSTISFTGTYTYNITNNVKCYYKFISITSPSTFKNWPKSLYHTSPSEENIFFTMDVDLSEIFKAFLTPQLNIEL